MIVRVKQEHIDHGVRLDCKACPVALAVQEQHCKVDQFAEVDDDSIVIYDESDPSFRATFVLPIQARIFVSNFDSRAMVSPFEFQAEEQDPEEALGC